MTGGRFLIAAIVALAVVALSIGAGLGLRWWLVKPLVVAMPERLILSPAGFADLPGWAEDRHGQALGAWLRSCAKLVAGAPERAIGPAGVGGSSADWREPCTAAKALDPGDDGAARGFFETWFRPFAAAGPSGSEGLFTGYYEPLLLGSEARQAGFEVPIYRRPDDLIVVELGDFLPDLAGRRITGRIETGRLKPYFSRAEIEAGALTGRGLELAWVDDPIDAFFLQIQGSGRIALAEGGEKRVGFDAQNGHGYTAIGKVLIDRGAIRREEVSMQSIRAWLAANPDQADAIMNHNASFVFFAEAAGEGPKGAQGVALTPERSLAVDRRLVPLGVPIWLAAEAPSGPGGAIKGAVRGDVFWGDGARAAAIAGKMKSRGRYFLLLPKTVTPPVSQ